MAVTPLPSLDRTSPAFRTEVDTFFRTQLPTFSTEINTLANDVQADVDLATQKAADASASAVQSASSANQSAVSAALSQSYANIAETALGSSSVPAFLSGEAVTAGEVRYSLITFDSYRAKSSAAFTIDPSNDETNWYLLGTLAAQNAALLWVFALN